MRKTLFAVGLFFLTTLVAADALTALDVLDQMRTTGETVKVTTRIEVYEHQLLQRASIMDVYVGTERRSLAVYKSEREAGQKVLMVDDNFWLFLPSSKRAMRITPMQKMLGEASVGDVAALDWSEDYKIVTQQNVGEEVQLSLAAVRKGLSYAEITLWVTVGDFLPRRADFYLKSGKLAKHATFDVAEQNDGTWRVTSLSLQDKVQKDQTTIIYYDEITVMTMEDKWFTPNFLLRETP